MPTPPKADTDGIGAGAAAARAPTNTAVGSTTGVQAALHFADQLEYSVQQLKEELRSYNDSNVIGRDAVLLQSFFSQILGRTMQVAQACKIQWSPTPTASNAAGRR